MILCCSNPIAIGFGALVMLFSLIWWLNHKFEEILKELRKK